ncbi:MAG: hypothetical protein P8Y03_30600 [Anaerolineales bacterium]|jgi:hypothetical protein
MPESDRDILAGAPKRMIDGKVIEEDIQLLQGAMAPGILAWAGGTLAKNREILETV